jgi:predicted DNA-binding protein
MTSIKVPTEVRDRLRSLAETHAATMAGTLEWLLSEAEDRLFWAEVQAAHVAGGDTEGYVFAESGARLMVENLADE